MWKKSLFWPVVVILVIAVVLLIIFASAWRFITATEASASTACREGVSATAADPAGVFFVKGPARSGRPAHLGGERYEYGFSGQVDLPHDEEGRVARHSYTCTIITDGGAVVHAPQPIITGGDLVGTRQTA